MEKRYMYQIYKRTDKDSGQIGLQPLLIKKQKFKYVDWHSFNEFKQELSNKFQKVNIKFHEVNNKLQDVNNKLDTLLNKVDDLGSKYVDWDSFNKLNELVIKIAEKIGVNK